MLPPDINRSGAEFLTECAEDGSAAIRFALAAVKRVGLQAMQDMVAARDAGGPFSCIADFAARVDPKLLNKMQIENLAKAGAFDQLEPNRARLVAGAELVLRRAQATAEDRASSQIGLFGGEGAKPEPLRLPTVPDWPQLEKLAFEAEAVGFHLSAHPLDTYAAVLKRLGVVPSAEIGSRARAGGVRLKLAGTVVASKERNTRTGSRMAWVTLSDTAGTYEVTLFSEVLSRARPLLEEGTAVLVTAEARLENEALRLTANDHRGAGARGPECRPGRPPLAREHGRGGADPCPPGARGQGQGPCGDGGAHRTGAGGGDGAARVLRRLAQADAGDEGGAGGVGGGGGLMRGGAATPSGRTEAR